MSGPESSSGKGRFFISLPFILLVAIFAILAVQCGKGSPLPFQYEDGTYRGIFADKNEIQVNVEFTLKDGIVTKASFRYLKGPDKYFLETGQEPYRSVISQYKESLEHLVGKPLAQSLSDLYHPERVVRTEVDAYTSATIRSSKIISAIRDALNRGVYRH